MKKTLLIAFFALIAGETFAQKVYLGTALNLGGQRTTEKDVDYENNRKATFTTKEGNFAFGISPEVGVIINNKFSVGFQLGASLAVSKDETIDSEYGDYKSRQRIFYFSPTASYYAGITEKLYWTPRFDVAFSLIKNTREYREDKKSIENWEKDFGVGFGFDFANFEYRATDHIYINAGLGIGHIVFAHVKPKKYNYDGHESDADDESVNVFSWGINDNISSVSFGVKYIF